MTNPFLIGKKVYLRPIEREDALTLQPWVNDPEVTQFMLLRDPMSLRDEEQFIERLSHSDKDIGMMIVRLDVDQPVGVTGFHQINHANRNAHFGITIGDKDAWGMGFGTDATKLMMRYAFESMNLHRVTLLVFEYNERAIRVYEKAGFKKEGILRQENYRKGRYWDTIIMGLLREEWQTQGNISAQ